MGRPPVRAVATFLVAPALAPGGLAAIAIKAAPLILMGAGLAVAYGANVWNIGAEGQFTLGAIAAGGVALSLADVAWWAFPAVIAAGVLSGMAWAGIVAWLRTAFGANEILTSLMLTYVAQPLVVYLVTGP